MLDISKADIGGDFGYLVIYCQNGVPVCEWIVPGTLDLA